MNIHAIFNVLYLLLYIRRHYQLETMYTLRNI